MSVLVNNKHSYNSEWLQNNHRRSPSPVYCVTRNDSQNHYGRLLILCSPNKKNMPRYERLSGHATHESVFEMAVGRLLWLLLSILNREWSPHTVHVQCSARAEIAGLPSTKVSLVRPFDSLCSHSENASQPHRPYFHVKRCWRNESTQNNYLSAAFYHLHGLALVCVQFFPLKICYFDVRPDPFAFFSHREIVFTQTPVHSGSVLRAGVLQLQLHFLIEDLSLRLLSFSKERTPRFSFFSVCWRILASMWVSRHCECTWMHVCVWIEYLFSFK